MKWEGDAVRLSASDLMRFMACAHASALDLDYRHGRGPEPEEDSQDAALLQRHGDAHEAAHLENLRRHGGVVEIDREMPFSEAVVATQEALRSGARIVFQGALEGGAWGGWSDFLERVEVPSELGPFSYEVADTKLKRRPDPKHLLQLVLYSDLLAPLQGRAADHAHVLLGDGSRATFRLAEYSAYARGARTRLEAFVTAPWTTQPVPCSSCDLCRWRVHCRSEWDGRDSLYRIAGISKSQVAKLEAADIVSMAQLAASEGHVSRLAEATLEKLRLQAKLQTERGEKGPHHVLRTHTTGKGFDLLWRPDPGDLFYDIEGDPFFSEDGVDGLEYLHGVWDGAAFTALWAHDLAAERNALIRLFEIFDKRLTAHPEAHVYHYASYELTALRKLCTRHGFGEAMLDRWLRERRFCDLYAVVRSGIATSEPSYSIKDMEALYGFERTGAVKTAGGSVVAYEAWRDTGDEGILAEIGDYNRLDCISTRELRDWLVRVRPDAPWPTLAPPQDVKHNERDAESEALRQRIVAAGLPDGRGQLLFDISQFHVREAKPAAWAVFDAASKTSEELYDDLDCLGGLVAVGPQEPDKRSVRRTYRFPPQETKVRAGKEARILLGDTIAKISVVDLDRKSHRITLKMGPSFGDKLPDRLDLLPTFAISADPIPQAIAKVVDDQLGARTNTAADDLLSRRPPRFKLPSPLPVPDNADPVAALIAVTEAMANTTLPVQGPPGTGKTYVAARAILNLIGNGNRVAVASNSHEAIRNVLTACIDALEAGDVALTQEDMCLVHRCKRDDDPLEPPYHRIHQARQNDDDQLFRGNVVGGTAWLFSREEMAGAFDYLFVDEAGQVSLANLVAMTNSARNVVLIGDPNQLPQVIQGSHPHPANLSCLDWMLDGAITIPGDRGLFLSVTRRMHPELCGYISDQFYEGRLTSHPDTACQQISAVGVPAAGAFLIPVAHQGRTQESPEEIAEISKTVETLLKGRWTDQEGDTRNLRPDDIIVVAPYNMQVNALSDALPSIRVGTVDKFQGQEAAVALVSMTTSSLEEATRGLDFLLSRERLNVAVSRGKALSLVFASPRIVETPCASVEQMRLVNALCALPRWEAGK